MKKKNKMVVRYKSHINLNAGIVIFGLISIYLLINIVIYFTTERTAFYEVISGSNAQEANVSYNGIAIRNEIVQSARDSGYIDYYVREGSRVSLNTTLYSIDSTGELNNLLSEASKKNPKLSSDNIDTLAGLISDYCNNYNEMNYSEIYNFKTSLKGTVVDLINMNSLENIAKEEGNTFSINNSASTGIVLYRIDNYENLKPKNLKASLFDKNSYVDVKFSSGTKTEKGNPIYKTVNDEEWSIAVQFTKKEAKKLGLTTVDATVSESSEIRQVVESLKGKVDAIYSPTDNMIAAGINTVSMVANEAKIPFIVAEEGMCTGGGLATYGVNYYKLGQQTAKQAVKILEGKAEPKDMPIEYQENADLIINKDTVKTLGIKIPEKLKKEAKMVTTQKKNNK